MKKIFILLLVFCATAAFAQAGGSVISGEPAIYWSPSHELRAQQHDMATEHSLLPTATYLYAQGERPLWELGMVPDWVPLGDVARAYRKEHEFAKKATFVLEKQK